MRASNQVVVIGEDGEQSRQVGYRIHIPKEGRRLLSIPIKVIKPGIAHFQVSTALSCPCHGSQQCDAYVHAHVGLQAACFAGKYGDAADIQFPIYPPATTESFVFYGTLANPNDVVLQPIVKPRDALPQYGGLQVRWSASWRRRRKALTHERLFLIEN